MDLAEPEVMNWLKAAGGSELRTWLRLEAYRFTHRVTVHSLPAYHRTTVRDSHRFRHSLTIRSQPASRILGVGTGESTFSLSLRFHSLYSFLSLSLLRVLCTVWYCVNISIWEWLNWEHVIWFLDFFKWIVTSQFTDLTVTHSLKSIILNL